MRKLGMVVRGLGLAFVLVLGCHSTEPKLKPPPQEEKLEVPPDTEARFSQPMEYPKGTPKSAQIKRGGNTAPLSDPTRFQSGAGRPGSAPY